jgi:hypothetical protein
MHRRLASNSEISARITPDNRQRPYSDHDTKKCGIAGPDRDDIDGGSLAGDVRFQVVNVLRGVDAPVVLFSSFIYAFGCFKVAAFFYVFHRAR